ncbi:16S rRNA (uracil(1498)-N(3))-methyltransferase [Salinispirillum sp. LH 10-3-1]|uniref:Ribosomal RNA small subunit methyltransferase E n=1 Tax=Salinispirillum sp. LH 10-3-1 TaxID=2952525 RepID=A0AB38YG81_9GAMM
MRISRVYESQPLMVGATVVVSDRSHQHLIKALRLADGAPVVLFNGDGHDYAATLTAVGKKTAQAAITASTPVTNESPVQVHIGLGMSLGDRMEYAIQKATEAGIAELTPLETERSELRLKGERADKKWQRWQQVAISAAEQCGRARVPVIHPPCALNSWLDAQKAELMLVLHHEHAQRLRAQPPVNSVAALIGPEGGLSEGDISAALQASFLPVAMGPRVLRTETAPVVLLAALNTLWGDY